MDGQQAERGAPSLLTLSARRGLNVAYAVAVRYMDHEERKEFDASLSMSMLDLVYAEQRRIVEAEMDRQRLIKQHAEIG